MQIIIIYSELHVRVPQIAQQLIIQIVALGNADLVHLLVMNVVELERAHVQLAFQPIISMVPRLLIAINV